MSDGQDQSGATRGRRPANAPAGRDALLLAATRCFADHGFDAAGVRMIASRAQAAPNLVAVHFGNKEGLWLACVDLLAQTMEARIAALSAMASDHKTPLRRRLELAIGMTAAYYDRNPDLRGFIARASAEPSPRAQIVAQRLLKPLYEAAHPLIQQGIDAGMIPIDDPAIVFVILNLSLGQPDRIGSALAMLSPTHEADDTSSRMGEALARLLLTENGG
jgi:AcrR family transcriptional regulator